MNVNSEFYIDLSTAGNLSMVYIIYFSRSLVRSMTFHLRVQKPKKQKEKREAKRVQMQCKQKEKSQRNKNKEKKISLQIEVINTQVQNASKQLQNFLLPLIGKVRTSNNLQTTNNLLQRCICSNNGN